MRAKNHCYFVYSVVLAFVFMGCENPTGNETGNFPVNISFMSQFIIENNSSSTKTITLNKAYHYNNSWDVRHEANIENGYPVSVDLAPGKGSSLETRASMNANIASGFILSFVLTIDDKHYVGWEETLDSGDPGGIVEYGLGYVNVIPEEIDPDDPKAFLKSKLTPKLVEYRLYRTDVTALYGVRITDEGVSFVLYKQSAD
jgi:hypothetical protein